MLYIHSTERILEALARHNLIDDAQRQTYEKGIAQAKADFAMNFIDGDVIYSNQPSREEGLKKIAHRRGVCQNCGGYFPVLTLKGNNYFCQDCLPGGYDRIDHHRYVIPSVALMAVYLHTDLIDPAVLKPVIIQTIDRFAENGPKGKIVGYEGGLVLYAAVEMGYRADEVAEILLGLTDEFGAFSEYYIDGCQNGTLCRPWESAINIEALIRYARSVSSRR